MDDEQQARDRRLKTSRALVVFVHLIIIVMSVSILYYEIINIMNMSNLELSKGWWLASIISVICQALTIGCVIFAIVSIFLDFKALSSWFIIIPVTGVSVALIASLSMGIPTLRHNFPNNYADKLSRQYTHNKQFWNGLKAIEKSYKCCGIKSVGDYQIPGGYSKAEGYCARQLKLIQFDILDEGFLRPIKWDFDLAFNTSYYKKESSNSGLFELITDGNGIEVTREARETCHTAALKFKEKLVNWGEKLKSQLDQRMGLSINEFTMTPSCGQLMGKLMADSMRLFMYTSGLWFLITLSCLGAFFYGRLKHAVITQQVTQQVVQQVQPQPQPQIRQQVYAPPVYTPPTAVDHYMTPRSSFMNSLDGYDMFTTHQPAYYRHPSQNVVYNPYVNYPRSVKSQTTVTQAPRVPPLIVQVPPSPAPPAKKVLEKSSAKK